MDCPVFTQVPLRTPPCPVEKYFQDLHAQYTLAYWKMLRAIHDLESKVADLRERLEQTVLRPAIWKQCGDAHRYWNETEIHAAIQTVTRGCGSGAESRKIAGMMLDYVGRI